MLARYEKGGLILTSNRGFAEWGEVFGHPVVATALLDRLLHHAVVIQIEGSSSAVLILVDGGEAEGPHRLGKGLGGYSWPVGSDSRSGWRCSTARGGWCGAGVGVSRTSAREPTANIPWPTSAWPPYRCSSPRARPSGII